jgi:hypothetical protein
LLLTSFVDDDCDDDDDSDVVVAAPSSKETKLQSLPSMLLLLLPILPGVRKRFGAEDSMLAAEVPNNIEDSEGIASQFRFQS